MLDDGPIDMSVFAALADPDAVEARAKADAEQKALDWPNLGRYEAANAESSPAAPGRTWCSWAIPSPRRGRWRSPTCSTTTGWPRYLWPDLTADAGPLLTPTWSRCQPKAVHLLCGTNDIAGNTGPTTPARYQACVRAMTELAAAHDIRVILGAIPPAAQMRWRPGFDPKPWVLELNLWLRSLAGERGFAFADYHAALRDESDALRADFSHDGVHPTRRGYVAMREVLAPLL